MSDRKFELSRRKALIGLGTVGAASAGAGMGTSAYFSDQEEFNGNTIQAGEFGLSVEQEIHNVDQDGIGTDETTFGESSDADGVWATNTITIEDAKPGDTYEFCWNLTCLDNPGHVALAADSTDEDGETAGNVTPDDVWGVDSGEFETLGENTNVDSVMLSDNNGTEVDYSSYYDILDDLLADLADGTLLDDEEGAIQFGAGDEWTLCVELHIPDEVGNELQGAELTWDMVFYAEQARHNDASGTASNAASVFAS